MKFTPTTTANLIGFFLGVGLFIAMLTILVNRLEDAEAYRELAVPIVEQYLASTSGLTSAAPLPEIRIEQRAELMIMGKRENRLSPGMARLILLIGVFLLFFFGGRLFGAGPEDAETLGDEPPPGRTEDGVAP